MPALGDKRRTNTRPPGSTCRCRQATGSRAGNLPAAVPTHGLQCYLPLMVAPSIGLSALLLLALPALAQTAAPEHAARGDKQLQIAAAARQKGDEALARRVAREVLSARPDDPAALAFLGYRWFRGRWRLPTEIAYLERAAGARASASTPPRRTPASPVAAVNAATPSAAVPAPKIQAEITRQFRRLWLQDDHAAQQARDALIALARSEGIAGLEPRVEREYWRARRTLQEAARAATGILTVRLQDVRLLGFDTVTVGFGTGSGRLMLPRTQSVSFGGTVAVPLGFGN
jgi:hypothetical protein